jgi:hypothetical protein
MPIGIDWPEDIYKESEIAYTFVLDDGREFPLYDTDIGLKDPTEDGELGFAISSASATRL